MHPKGWRMQNPLWVSLVLVFTLSVPAGGQASRNPSSDFGFRFEYGLCTSEVIDTFKGIFTREMKPAPDVPVPLTLEAQSLTEIHRAIADARFFEYPSPVLPHRDDWRGTPLVDLATIVSLIGATHSEAGLHVRAELDRGPYPAGVTVTDAQMATIRLERHRFHGDWNYTISPVAPRSVLRIVS